MTFSETEKSDSEVNAGLLRGQATAYDGIAKTALVATTAVEIASALTDGRASERMRQTGFVGLVVTVGATIMAATRHAKARSLDELRRVRLIDNAMSPTDDWRSRLVDEKTTSRQR